MIVRRFWASPKAVEASSPAGGLFVIISVNLPSEVPDAVNRGDKAIASGCIQAILGCSAGFQIKPASCISSHDIDSVFLFCFLNTSKLTP